MGSEMCIRDRKKAEDAIAQGYKHKEMSEEEFESLPEKDGKTIYLIYEEE